MMCYVKCDLEFYCDFSLQLFISRAGTKLDTANANRYFGEAWRKAMPESTVSFTARGGRFGAVMHIAEAKPEAQA